MVESTTRRGSESNLGCLPPAKRCVTAWETHSHSLYHRRLTRGPQIRGKAPAWMTDLALIELIGVIQEGFGLNDQDEPGFTCCTGWMFCSDMWSPYYVWIWSSVYELRYIQNMKEQFHIVPQPARGEKEGEEQSRCRQFLFGCSVKHFIVPLGDRPLNPFLF